MPAEARRLRAPVRTRDWAVIVAVVTAALLLVAAAAVAADRRAHRVDRRCVEFDRAGVMGGGTWRRCGLAAQKVCAHPPPGNPTLAAQCDENRRR